MTEFTSHPAGSPNWVDLMSPNVDDSIAFYTAVFGWQANEQADPEGNRVYVLFTQNGKNVAGLGPQSPGIPKGTPAAWHSYIATEDIEATAKAVGEAGGTVVMGPMQVFDSGSMAVFQDPTGAFFCGWQAGNHIGAQVANSDDTWSWNELMTRDCDSALEFYTKVFGWSYQAQQMPHGTYNVVNLPDTTDGIAGIMAMPENLPDMVPNHWGVYFTVGDLKTSMAKVTEAGGAAVMEPFEIPHIGTMVTMHDNQGGSFNLLQPASRG